MRKLFISLLILLPFASFAQYDYGFMNETYFSRQPSARAEALGKAYTAIDGDLASIFYNPAGTARLKGFELNTSFNDSPTRGLNNAGYNFISAGFHLNQYLTVGLSRNHFTYGQEVEVI